MPARSQCDYNTTDGSEGKIALALFTDANARETYTTVAAGRDREVGPPAGTTVAGVGTEAVEFPQGDNYELWVWSAPKAVTLRIALLQRGTWPNRRTQAMAIARDILARLGS